MAKQLSGVVVGRDFMPPPGAPAKYWCYLTVDIDEGRVKIRLHQRKVDVAVIGDRVSFTGSASPSHAGTTNALRTSNVSARSYLEPIRGSGRMIRVTDADQCWFSSYRQQLVDGRWLPVSGCIGRDGDRQYQVD